MQASVYGASGILPALSRTLHLESGIVGERRLSAGDDCAASDNNSALGIFIFPVFIQVKLFTAFVFDWEKFDLLPARRVETNFRSFTDIKS